MGSEGKDARQVIVRCHKCEKTQNFRPSELQSCDGYACCWEHGPREPQAPALTCDIFRNAVGGFYGWHYVTPRQEIAQAVRRAREIAVIGAAEIAVRDAAPEDGVTTSAVAQASGLARYTYRLRVPSAALTSLLTEWDRCRWVWNECVAQSRAAHQAKQTCGPAQLDKMLTGWRTEHEWLRTGASVPQQQTIRDFAKSRAKALKDIKARLPIKQRAGMPRFKKKDLAYPTLNYTRNGFRLKDGRLHLAGGIALTVVWSRDLPAGPSSVRIYRDSLGHWYASFVVSAETQPLPATGRCIGIDWGVKQTATTTSDDHDLPHAEHGNKAAARLARYQRKMARRKPERGQTASSGYRSAKRQAAKLHKKVARQRQDGARKWAKKVVRDHDVIAVEDFRPKFLAKTTMARKAADAAISTTKQALIEMARKHGRDIRLVHPAYTTMDCGHCGARTKHALPLSKRTYTCTTCGAVSSRDKNSARVMLIRAGLNPAGVDRVRPDRPPGNQAA